MSNINKFLANILAARYGKDVRQSIHDAIKEIDSVASTAQNSASNSAKSALASETSAKASMESALVSEANAKQYMETAFSGTPEGYAALVEQVDSIDIKASSDTTLYKTAPGGYRLTELVGATVQNGEPSQDNPIAIENTGDCVEMMNNTYIKDSGQARISTYGSITCKPWIPCNTGDVIRLVIPTALNVYFIFYNDKTLVSKNLSKTNTEHSIEVPSGINAFRFYIEATGTTAEAYGKITLTINGKYVGLIVEHRKNIFDVNNSIEGFYNSNLVGSVSPDYKMSVLYPVGEYVVSWVTTKNYTYLFYYNENKQIVRRVVLNASNGSAKVNPQEGECYFAFMYIVEGTSDIQIEAGEVATEFEEYQEKVTTFFLTEPMRKRSMLYKENGLYKVAHYFGEHEVNVTSIGTISNGNKSVIVTPKNKRQVSLGNALCTHATYKQLAYTDGTFYENPVNFVLCGSADDTLETMQAKYNGAILMYELATPTIEVLDTESQIALNGLETFDGVTYIGVDSKVKPTSISGEYGTSQVGAYTLKCMNDNDTDRVERAELKAQLNELQVALVALGSEV